MKLQLGFFKTTALGGVIFLLPLIVLGALVGQVVPIVMTVAEALREIVPLHSPGGIALLIAAAIGILTLLCFAAGVVANWSFGRRVSAWFEKNVQMLFPRYVIIRDQMTETVGSESEQPRLKPVLVTFHDHECVAFETDRSGDRVSVYLPGSPDPWSGRVVLVKDEQVRVLELEFSETAGVCERLGRESVATIVDGLQPGNAETDAS